MTDIPSATDRGGAPGNPRPPSRAASVVICTYNRADGLRATLESVIASTGLDGVDWEIVVVDNNSADHTADTILDFARRAPVSLRAAFEPRQGLSHARNRGVAVARGRVLAFTDDDVRVEPGWLAQILAAFRARDADAVGGKILPAWPGEVPRWLTPDLYGALSLLDHGDEPLDMTVPHLWGANFAVRARHFARHGGFDTRYGVVGGKLYGGEETAFLQRLLDHGLRLVYWPGAVVRHEIAPERMRRAYFRRWYFDRGEQEGSLCPDASARTLFGTPYYHYRLLGVRTRTWMTACARRAPDAFTAEVRALRQLGFLYGRLRHRSPNPEADRPSR